MFIHFYQEAENERMHLMTFLEVKKSRFFGRALVMIGQVIRDQ
jgi:hypothetical protein